MPTSKGLSVSLSVGTPYIPTEVPSVGSLDYPFPGFRNPFAVRCVKGRCARPHTQPPRCVERLAVLGSGCREEAIGDIHPPLSSEYGTYRTVKARLWP